MGFRPKLIAFWAKIKRLPKRYTIPASVIAVLIILYGVIFLVEKPVVFSYAGATCVRQLTLFPAIHKVSTGTDFTMWPSKPVQVAGVTIASREACFTPIKAPREGVAKISIAPLGGWLLQKTFAITVSPPPKAQVRVLGKPISATKPLTIPLNETDKIFSYRIKANGTDVPCTPKNKAISCDLPKLNLSQGTQYSIQIVRQFAGTPVATVIKKDITTLSAISVADSSIKGGETVYSKPRTIDLVFNKKVAKIKPVLYRIDAGKRVPVVAEVAVNDKTVRITTAEDLARSTDYELTADTVEASDGSGLEDPYVLAFKVSGGPKVTGVSIGKIAVPLGATATISFDQPLSDKQDISKIISLSGGAVVSGRKNNQLFVSLANVPKCGDFGIKITNDLQSNYDIAGNSAWSYGGRMICHTIGTIGYSTKGRAISAYYFGSGPANVVYTGAIHGNEVSTKYLMERWINDLEANARSIPAGKTVVVVPQINPDGVSSGTRVNARNVDLNRNFATSDWQRDITTVNNQPFPGGGGEAPMSERETQAIASLVQRLRPVAVLSYHSIGSVVAANQAGNSGAFAAMYSQLSGYRNATGQSGETFEYAISGTADDWYAEKLGVASVLVELGSHTSDQFSRNQRAMWAILNF